MQEGQVKVVVKKFKLTEAFKKHVHSKMGGIEKKFLLPSFSVRLRVRGAWLKLNVPLLTHMRRLTG